MDANQFKDRMQELAAMTAKDASMDLFTQEYERLLNEVKALPGPRYEMLSKMKMMLMVQSAYLLNAHIKYQKMVQGPYSTRMQ